MGAKPGNRDKQSQKVHSFDKLRTGSVARNATRVGHPKDFRSSDKSVRAARFRNTKRAGERSEAAFLYKAAELGFGVAKPWGDSERYDFIVDNGRRLLRVQVKATDCLRAQAYETRATYTVGKGRAVYSRRDIDFLVAHVVPLDVWYVLPIEACAPAPMLRFYPHREAKQMRLEKYKEAWVLMRENPRAAKTALRSVQGRL